MKTVYRVWYRGFRSARYETLEEARKVCDTIFEKTGIVVALTEH